MRCLLIPLPTCTGSLHLAYFATEITLHRQILRTLSASNQIDPYLLHICRSAAKTRLISAMDFVNRLKPEHLQSFWYFSSKVNFALIGTFGSLLWATSPSIQEAEFYKARLSEYRWTLRVSSRGADFMEFAVGVLDASAGYLQQEQWKKRGPLVGTVIGYQSTVGENFGLGMGVGSGSSMVVAPQPLPQPPSGWGRSLESVQRQRGQLSPVTNEEDSDEEEEAEEGEEGEDGDSDDEEYDEMMDEESAYSDAGGRYAAVSSSNNKSGFAAYRAAAADVSNASTPGSSSASSSSNIAAAAAAAAGMDFFMIPNMGFGSSGGE
jgi:hypothetical protein